MGKSGISLLTRLKELNAGAKGLLLVVGAYVATIGVVVFIIALAIMIFIDTTNCGAVSRVLPVLWGTIAAVFLASVVVVGVVTWKVITSVTGCLAIVAAYGVTMLASYVVIAFGLMVAFNC